MPHALRSLLIAGVLTALTVGGGLLLASPEDSPDDGAPAAGSSRTTPAAPVTGTPLADYDTGTVTVQRMPFCDLVAPEAVERALGAPPTDTLEYANGESAAVTKRVTDIAHEYGCTWSIAGVSARAWVFAPPVTRRQARSLVTDAAGEDECGALSSTSDFGTPSVGVLCRTATGVRTSYRGLFGDAWLACSLSGPFERDEATERTGEFCVAAAQAASTPSS